ncbi:MAG TPA: tRNA 2-selenouridine(34) synthase MnmH [Hanamia sp.]|nr:tRNA 2-selenouridine(34) synthase MnmH [Hanamia sp.]
MPIEQISIEKFLQLSEELPVLDVRSPGEYSHARIPGAFTLPIFNDLQRKTIGTAYKKESREIAVNIGLNYFSERMKKVLPEANIILDQWRQGSENVDFSIPNGETGFLIHCWRGGMRSATIAWLLSLYGHKTYVLEGGYKSFRNWVLGSFEKTYSFKILGGYTGSGKTEVLKEMRAKGENIIDLEAIANHKGSAFGALGEAPQPSQEMFENLLAIQLWKNSHKTGATNNDGQPKSYNEVIWLEDECRNIGTVNIPATLWNQMRDSPLYFLDIPHKKRLDHIVCVYGNFDKQSLEACILQIKKRLGGLETKNALDLLASDKRKDSFSILMNYYDKQYSRALDDRENIQVLLNKIPAESVDIRNSSLLI